MKNIKKYYPLIVGLVLLISVAAYGTRAYFSDSTKEDAGIELTLGKVDVTSDSGLWMYATENKNDNIDVKGAQTEFDTKSTITVEKKEQSLSKFVDIENARPGDSFSKEFTFKNSGSLDQVLTFDPNGNATLGIFEVSWENNKFDINNKLDENDKLNENNSINLKPNEKFTAKMTVTVKLTDVEQEYNKETNKHVKYDEFFGETVEVKTKQTNVPTAE